MRLIDADELKGMYSKQEKRFRKLLMRVCDKTETYTEAIPVEWIETWAKSRSELYQKKIDEMLNDWRKQNEKE